MKLTQNEGVINMGNNQGRGSNLTQEDRAKGGENSHSGGSEKDEQTNMDIRNSGGQSDQGQDQNQGKGWFNDSEEHAKAGSEGGKK
jgi:hypothetical protein